MSSLSELFERTGTLLLDGALGTELAHRGVGTALPLWSAAALDSAPDAVGAIHRDYRDAGAHIITTNSFRTTTYTYQLAGAAEADARERARRATRLAVRLARQAADERTLVAGSMAPVGDCYSPGAYPGDRVAAATYGELAGWLAHDGVDLLLLETHITLAEANIALRAATATGLPTLVSFLVDGALRLWGGAPLSAAIADAEQGGAQGVLINCVTLPVARLGVAALARMTSLPFGVYANAGRAQPTMEGTLDELVPDNEFLVDVDQWLAVGARMIGGCCGTTPATISALAQHLSNLDKAG